MINISTAGLGNEQHHPFDSHRLWSLWDMIKLPAANYIRVGELIHQMVTVLQMVETEREHQIDATASMTESEARQLSLAMRGLSIVCQESGLTTSQELLAGRIENPPRTSGELAILAQAVKAELKTRLFLHVPQEKAPFWESKTVLNERAHLAFPNAHVELQEASDCYALGRNTASAFHAMRAAEIGLWALARELGVSFPNHPNELAQWLELISQTESKIRAKQDLKKGVAKDEELEFYSDAAVHFLCFKDAWRSRLAHARATCDETRALSILNHTREFFEALAKRLKE